MNRLTSTLAAGALTIGLLGVTDSAMAVAWYSQSHPVRAVEDGVTQGGAYGNFYNSNGSYARSVSHRRDYRPGGDGVYVETGFAFYYKSSVDKEPGWNTTYTDQTGRTTSGRWATEDPARALRADSAQARGAMKVCEDQNLSPDPCSATVIRSFSY